MTQAQRVSRNIVAQFGGRGITMLLGLGTLALLSRYLGPERFGEYQLVLAFLLLVDLSDLGISTVTVRMLSTDDHRPDDLLGQVLSVRLGLAFVSGIVALCVAFLPGYSTEFRAAMALAALSYPIAVVGYVYSAPFAAYLRMEYAALGSIAQAVVALAAMGAVAITGGGLVLFIAAYLAGVAANAVVCIALSRQFARPRFTFDRSFSRMVLRQSLPIGLAAMTGVIYDRVDILLLSAFTSGDEIGHFGFAYRTIDMGVPLSFYLVGSVYPLLAGYIATGDTAAFRGLYQRSHDLLLVASLCALIFAMLLAPVVVKAVGGAEYNAAVTSVRILAVAIVPIWLVSLADHGLISAGRENVIFVLAAVLLAVHVSLSLALIPALGKEGAALATVTTEVVGAVPTYFILRRAVGWAPSFGTGLRVLPAVIASMVFAYFLPLPAAAAVAVAAALVIAGGLLSGVASISEIRSLLRPAPVPAEAAVRTAP